MFECYLGPLAVDVLVPARSLYRNRTSWSHEGLDREWSSIFYIPGTLLGYPGDLAALLVIIPTIPCSAANDRRGYSWTNDQTNDFD